AVRNSSASSGTAGFDWFRVRSGSGPGTPIDCEGGGSCSVESDPFEGIELDPKWEIINPSSSEPTVGDGHLTLPVIQGDLFGGTGTAQVLAQGVPTDESWIATAKIAHANID